MENVDVSVIIPCHNYARFLPDAVGSVVRQTFRRWEIVVVDDGSSDDSIDVARGLMARYPDHRIRLFGQPNRGPAAARNAGARFAAGAYLLFLDADDMLAPTLLERTTAILRERPAVAFVYTGMRLFDQDDHQWPSVPYDMPTLAIENFVLTQALIRRAAWDQVGGFDTLRFPHGSEDWDLWLRLAAAGWQGWHVDEPLVWYRRHGQSMTDKLRAEHHWDARAQIIRKHPDLYGPRLAAWAAIRCGRRGLPCEGPRCDCAHDLRELPPAPEAAPRASPAPRAPVPTRAPVAWRRIMRKVPFRLRFRVKCQLRRVQLALRAAAPWLYV